MRLVKEAGKQVEENFAEIARRLLNDSLKGHVQCTRLLLDLAERPTGEEEAEKAKPKRSWVRELEEEQEWIGELWEAEAETGSGGLEPEG